jgi:hypothetical protein
VGILQQKDTVHVVSSRLCQGDWLTLEKFSHIVHSNMMSSRGGKLKEEREREREGGEGY